MVRRLSSVILPPSLNDLGHGVEVRDPVRGVGEDPLWLIASGHRVLPHPRGCANDRSQGIDVAGVDGVELFDEAQNGGQFAGKAVLVRVGNGQPCEAGCSGTLIAPWMAIP